MRACWRRGTMSAMLAAILLLGGCHAFLEFGDARAEGLDASTEAAAGEAGLADAAADAFLPSSDAAADGWCTATMPQSTLFCDDFEGDDFDQKWTLHDTDLQAYARVDSVTGARGSRSLLSHRTNTADTCVYARAEKLFEGTYREARADFAVRIADETKLNDDYAVALVLENGAISCFYQLGFRWEPTVGAFAIHVLGQVTGGVPVDAYVASTTGSVPRGKFVTMRFYVNFIAKTLSIEVEGRAVFVTALPSFCPAATGSMRLGTGLYCTGDGPAVRELRFDDVVFEAR